MMAVESWRLHRRQPRIGHGECGERFGHTARQILLASGGEAFIGGAALCLFGSLILCNLIMPELEVAVAGRSWMVCLPDPSLWN